MAVSAKRTNEIRTLLRLRMKIVEIGSRLSALRSSLLDLSVVYTDTKTVRDELAKYQASLNDIEMAYLERYVYETRSSSVDAKTAATYLHEGIVAADALKRRIDELYAY